MKRIILCLTLAALVAANTGCYGSFQLTKKLYKWNGSIGDKWVHSAIFWVFNIIPVYSVCAFVDVVAFNLIEFWAGSNPLALNSDIELHKTFENNGKVYEVTMGKGVVTIAQSKGPDVGKKISLAYKQDASAWYLSDGKTSRMVVSFDPKPLNNVNLYYPDGKVVSQSLNETEVAVAVK
jgi:hypothetical protein